MSIKSVFVHISYYIYAEGPNITIWVENERMRLMGGGKPWPNEAGRCAWDLNREITRKQTLPEEKKKEGCGTRIVLSGGVAWGGRWKGNNRQMVTT